MGYQREGISAEPDSSYEYRLGQQSLLSTAWQSFPKERNLS